MDMAAVKTNDETAFTVKPQSSSEEAVNYTFDEAEQATPISAPT